MPRGEIDSAVTAIRAQDRALSALRGAVEAVLSGDESAVRAWYQDWASGHDPAGIEVPGKMALLKAAMERVTQEMDPQIVMMGTQPPPEWKPTQKFQRLPLLRRKPSGRKEAAQWVYVQLWEDGHGNQEWRDVPVESP